MESLTKKVNGFLAVGYFFKILHLRCLTGFEYVFGLLKLLCRGSKRDNRNVDICQTDYSIPSKLGSSSYLEVIKGGKKVQIKGTLIQV